MSDYDDWDYGRDIQEERDRDYEHEIAIAQHLEELERHDYDRTKSYTWG